MISTMTNRFRTKMECVVAIWNNFWYRPISTRILAAFRILFGLLLIQFVVLLMPDFFVWFGKNGIVASNTINSWQPYLRFNILNLFPNSDLWLITVFAFFIIAAICLTIGFLTRFSSIVVFLCLISFHARDYLIINSGDNFMRLLSFWLIFSPAGQSFSIDNWLTKRNNIKRQNSQTIDNKAEPWAQRMMQINMALLYAQAFYKKIGGKLWQDGSAVYYSSHMEDMHRFPFVYLFDHLWTCKLLTWCTLGIEFALFTLVWVKPLRYYVLALGTIMHLTIDWTMNIPQFEWIMIYSYVLFIDPPDLERFLSLVNKQVLKKSVNKSQFN